MAHAHETVPRSAGGGCRLRRQRRCWRRRRGPRRGGPPRPCRRRGRDALIVREACSEAGQRPPPAGTPRRGLLQHQPGRACGWWQPPAGGAVGAAGVGVGRGAARALRAVGAHHPPLAARAAAQAVPVARPLRRRDLPGRVRSPRRDGCAGSRVWVVAAVPEALRAVCERGDGPAADVREDSDQEKAVDAPARGCGEARDGAADVDDQAAVAAAEVLSENRTVPANSVRVPENRGP